MNTKGHEFTGMWDTYADSGTTYLSVRRIARAGSLAPPSLPFVPPALQAAKRDMENASNDFAGHKKAAIEACDKAIAQLELVLKNDTK